MRALTVDELEYVNGGLKNDNWGTVFPPDWGDEELGIFGSTKKDRGKIKDAIIGWLVGKGIEVTIGTVVAMYGALENYLKNGPGPEGSEGMLQRAFESTSTA